MDQFQSSSSPSNILPERTFVVGLCNFHKQFDNIIRMEASTGLLYFTDDIKKCIHCHPHLERGIVLSSQFADKSIRRRPNFVSMLYDEQGPVDEGYGWPRQQPSIVSAPKPTVNIVSTPKNCEVCGKIVAKNDDTCQNCLTCRHCGKSETKYASGDTHNVTDGICKMCRYYESLHANNVWHKFSKCSFCAAGATATGEEQAMKSGENGREEKELIVKPPSLNPDAPVFVPAEPRKPRWFGLI